MRNMSPSPSPPPPLHHCQTSPFSYISQTSEKAEQEHEFNGATPTPGSGDKVFPKRSAKKRPESVAPIGGGGPVSCSKCRPHAREKFSVVPLDNNGVSKQFVSMASPNGILKSIVSSFTRKSPKSSDWAEKEEHWKIALGEISHKLIQATRKRDEAILEASKLKYSMAELEKKLNKLEVYCHSLKSGLEECASHPNTDLIVQNFLSSVSESRSSVRQLSRSLAMQLRQMGGKMYQRIQSKSSSQMEAVLTTAFYEDFESIGFQKNSPNPILNLSDRSESNIASFKRLHRLSWEEVLSKGTRHFSEDFSRFCDRKMSDIVAMLEWNRAWPEPLLQAFFMAAKSVWLVHLLANAVHPSLPIFRVESGVAFDAVFMEDVAGDKATELPPATVRLMVSPGFYVFHNLIKCKVLCKYHTKLNN